MSNTHPSMKDGRPRAHFNRWRKKDGLTSKRRDFCLHLLDDPKRVGADAYEKAFKCQNRNSARMGATRLMKCPAVRNFISARTRDLAKDTDVSSARIIEELTDIGYSTLKNYVSWSAETGIVVKPSAEINDKDFSALKKITIRRDTTANTETITFELFDKLRALELLGKDQQMFGEKPEHKGIINFVFNNITRDEKPIVGERMPT